MELFISTLGANEATVYISEFINVAEKTPVQAYYGLVNFDSTLYLNKIARQIGHVSQLHFRILPEAGYVEVRNAHAIGRSHLSSNILDTNNIRVFWRKTLWIQRQKDLQDLYDSDGYAIGLDLTMKAYQMNQYTVINQRLRNGWPFFGYTSDCLETAKKLYEVGGKSKH